MRAPFFITGRQVVISASVGMAFGRPGESAHELMRQADVALYQAKAAGRATFAVFAPERPVPVSTQLERAWALHRAIERDELEVVFEPEVNLATGVVMALNASVIWPDADRPDGLVAANLRHLAEETGLAIALGRWTLRQLCQHGAAWRAEFGDAVPTIGVVVTPRQLRQSPLIGELSTVLETTGFPPSLVRLGLGERLLSALGDDAAARLDELKRLGVSLALEDVGGGPITLSALRGLPLDVFVMAPALVHSAGDRGGQAVLRALTNLGHDFGARVVASGVATPAQQHTIQAIGLDDGRGPVFSHPLSAHAVTDLLRAVGPRTVIHLPSGSGRRATAPVPIAAL